MSISGIEGIGASGFTPYVAPQVGTTTGSTSLSTGTSDVTGTGKEFGHLVLDGLDRLAVKAATGDLTAIHDYTIAATEANVSTQLTVAVRNKAVEAFNEIMRMQV